MRLSYLALFFALLLSFTSALATQDDKAFHYLGSFSFSRFSESEHIYISEYRLWRKQSKLYGVYLDVAGLYGDHKTDVYKITRGTIDETGTVMLKSKWHEFKGRLTDNRLEGVLMQGDMPVWGGIEDSDTIILKKGTNIKGIREKSFGDPEQLERWIASLQAKR